MSLDPHPEEKIHQPPAPEQLARVPSFEKLMIAHAASFLLMLDTSLNIVQFSSFAAQRTHALINKKLEAGMNVAALLQPTFREEAMDALRVALDGRRQTFFFCIHDLEKRPNHFLAILSPAFSENGEVTAIVVTCRALPGNLQVEGNTIQAIHALDVFRGIPLAAFVYQPETLQLLEVNQWVLQHYGYSEAELLSMKVVDLHPNEEQEAVVAEIEKNKAKTVTTVSQWHHLRKDGTQVNVEVWGNNLLLDGHRLRMLIANDISSKVKAEAELRESNERFQLAAKASFDALYDWDIVNDTLHWEVGLTTLFGWKPEEVTLTKWGALLHPDERKQVIANLYEHINDPKQSFWRYEYRFANSTGQWRNVLERGYIVRDEAGRPLRCVGVVQDITSIKESEKALRESNERFGYVMNATSDIVWDWDVSSAEILFSEHYQSVLGWELPPSRKIPGREFFQHVYPNDQQRVKNHFKETVYNSTSTVWESACGFSRSDGSYAYLLVKAYIIRNNEGAPVRMIGAMHDISEQQYQQDLQDLELQVYALSSKPGTTLPVVLEAMATGISKLHENVRACIAVFENAGVPQVICPGCSNHVRAWVQKSVTGAELDTPQHSASIQTYLFQPGELQEDGGEDSKIKQAWKVPVWYPGEGVQAMLLLLVQRVHPPSAAQQNAVLRLQNLLRTMLVHHHSVAQIRVANERFDTVLKATHDLIWDWDMQTNVFYRSLEGMRQIYGEPEAVITTGIEPWISRVHADDVASLRRLIQAARKKQGLKHFELEYRVKRNDGSYAWIYDRGLVIRDEEGKAVRMTGAEQDISERKRLEGVLLQKELDRQREISRATIDAQELQRAEIGKELHDNVNQILTTTKLYLDLAQSSTELREELLEKANRNVVNIINEIRQLSRSLMDPSLGDLGLVDSVKNLVEDINLTRRLNIRFKTGGQIDDLIDQRKKLMIYRIIQEALNNIVRHAHASKADVNLQHFGKQFLLQISDDGVGFSLEKTSPGTGLNNIRNRVYLINGTLKIIAAPNQGTTIEITF